MLTTELSMRRGNFFTYIGYVIFYHKYFPDKGYSVYFMDHKMFLFLLVLAILHAVLYDFGFEIFHTALQFYYIKIKCFFLLISIL